MAERLNVLLVVIGCARADRLSSYGYGRETTPFLDQLGREGVRFPHMFATAPTTLAAHGALFTGLHSATHGATEESRSLSARYNVMPRYLKAAGYRAAAFCTNPWISPDTGFGQAFDAFFTQRYRHRFAARALLYGRKASDRLLRRDDAGGRRTNAALRRWIASSDQPFFAFVHYNETHMPFQLPPPYDRLFVPRALPASRVRAVNQDGERCVGGDGALREEDGAILQALYDGALRYVDTRVREVAEFLRARGEWERTLCIVTGDHGEHLGERGRLGHACGLADALLHVPLLLRCPPRVPQGFVVDELASTVDMLPTILQVLALPEAGARLHGRALLEEGRATTGPAFTIAERFRPDVPALQRRFPDWDPQPFDVRQKAIRTRREKFIWRSDEANELYDLVNDPAETQNVIARESDRAETLRRQLFDWLASVERWESEAPALEGGRAERAADNQG